MTRQLKLFYFTVLLLVGSLLFLAAVGKAACIVDTTIIFTNKYMVDKVCREMSVGEKLISDRGTPILPYPMNIIGGCTNGIITVLPDNLDPKILVHELNHLMNARCPKHKKDHIQHPDDHTFPVPAKEEKKEEKDEEAEEDDVPEEDD